MRTFGKRWACGILLAVVFLTSGGRADAAIRRILLVGDSWPMFMWTGYDILWHGRAFQETLIERGYERWEEWGQDTAIGGTLARQWGSNELVAVFGMGKLDLIRKELEENPNIDIVHLSIGGNDYLRGDYSDILGDSRFNHGWKKAWGVDSPDEIAFFNAICEQVRIVILTCLDARPDVRVALCDYDYMYDNAGGGTVQETNEAGTRLGMRKLTLCQSISALPEYRDRCFFVNPYGLLQWTYGYPNPVHVGQQQIYGPMGQPGTGGSILPPGGYPDYTPFKGGDIQYPSPMIAVMEAIHLNKVGYLTLARYCIDEFYGTWLDLPKVLSIAPSTPHPVIPGQVYSPTGLKQVAFEVTFTEPVSGVDKADFDAVMHGGLAGASIADVEEGKDALTYTVHVNTGTGDGTLDLAVLDNDSIADGDGNPLGGEGVNNGYFAYGGSYEINRAYALPLVAWSLIPFLLAASLIVMKKQKIA